MPPSLINEYHDNVILSSEGDGDTSYLCFVPTTTYLDADGNIVAQETTDGSTVIVSIAELAATPVVVVNKTGTELPATGGIGTTIFYIIGAILVIGAGVALVTRRRMNVQ